MSTTDVYKVRLEGQGLTLEREVSTEVGQRIAVLILTGAEDSASAGRREKRIEERADLDRTVEPATAKPAGGTKLSAREYLTEYGPKRAPDKVTTLASYLKTHGGKKVVTSAEIRKAFEDAAERVPGNLARDINWAVQAGWLAPSAENPGSFYVTRSGDDAVAKKFPKEVVKKTKIVQGSRKGAKKAKQGD